LKDCKSFFENIFSDNHGFLLVVDEANSLVTKFPKNFLSLRQWLRISSLNSNDVQPERLLSKNFLSSLAQTLSRCYFSGRNQSLRKELSLRPAVAKLEDTGVEFQIRDEFVSMDRRRLFLKTIVIRVDASSSIYRKLVYSAMGFAKCFLGRL